jgi:hypothetical protein
MIQGLGDLAVITTTEILKHYSKQLETLSWGLAEQYHHILAILMSEIRH